jgi:ferrochelatase
LPITRNVAAKLQTVLEIPVYVGMRHWHPTIRETVTQMAADGVEICTAIVMAPHYSRMSVGAYRNMLRKSLAEIDAPMAVDIVESWGMQPEYLDGNVAAILEAMTRFPPAARDEVHVVFTAHSLPAAILQNGDPYDAQLRQTAGALAERLGLIGGRWTFCYQSAPKADIPWLGPQVEQVIPALASAGRRNALVAPIGFIADHVEILYDLDIALQEIALIHDVHLERSAMLNDRPALIEALAAIVHSRESGDYPRTFFVDQDNVLHAG